MDKEIIKVKILKTTGLVNIRKLLFDFGKSLTKQEYDDDVINTAIDNFEAEINKQEENQYFILDDTVNIPDDLRLKNYTINRRLPECSAIDEI